MCPASDKPSGLLEDLAKARFSVVFSILSIVHRNVTWEKSWC